MVFAITIYPLSSGFRNRFESTVGVVPEYLNLGELRRLGMRRMLATLIGKSGTCYLPMEDDNGLALLPVLHSMAAVTRASFIILVRADLSERRLSRIGALRGLLGLISASISGQYVLRRCDRELKALERAGRRHVDLPSRTRVAYLKTNLWLGLKAGGSIGHVAGVVNGLIRAGKKVDYYSAETPIMLNPLVAVHALEAPKVYGVPAEANLWRFHHTFIAQVLPRMRENPPDLIYQRMSVANYSGLVLARELKIPLIIEYNGSEVWIARNWGRPLRYERVAELAERVCLQQADLVVTISDVLRDDLLAKGVSADRVVVYPNGIDPDIYDAERFSFPEIALHRAKLGVANDALVITFVGTFGEWHGTEVLAQAIKQIATAAPAWVSENKVHFLLIGDGLKMQEVRRTLDEMVPKSLYTLTGLLPQADTVGYLAASDIFVSPHVRNRDNTRFFGSPTKLFEYLAMGRAVIASDLDQIGEVLSGSPGVDGLGTGTDLSEEACAVLVQPGDVDQLVQAIRSLVENASLRAELGVRARRRALRSFTWDRHVAEILDGLERVLPSD